MQEHRPDGLDRLGELVAARSTKIVLAGLIIFSVLPFPVVEQRLRPLFLLAFGLELFIRVALLVTRRTERTPTELVFVGIDLAAFLSFLPIERWLDVESMGVLTLLRLSRLLVLARFGRELVRDIYLIMTRREQLQQFALVTLAVLVLSFVSAVLLAQLHIPYPYNGDSGAAQDFWDRLWWSFRALESADNLIPTLEVHPLIGVLSLLLTVTGVFIISFIIGIGANVVEQLMRAERRRPVGYKGHSLVIGPVQDSEILVREFVRIYDKHRPLRRLRLHEIWAWLVRGGPRPRRHALPRMALLGPGDDPPAYLYDAMMRWVVYRQGDGADPEALARVHAQHAKRVILLARPDAGPDSDAMTIAALTALRAVNPHAHAFIEVLESENCDIVHNVGGAGTFPLDVPRFMGLFLCQHLIVPGVELLYRDLLTAGGSEFYTHIFVDREDSAAFMRQGVGASLSFSEMARCAFLEYGVLLAGVFLGEAHLQRVQGDLVPVEGLVRWMNPELLPEDSGPVEALGGRPGLVPLRTLRGLIGVSETYVPLKRYARALANGRGTRAARPGSDASLPGSAVARPGPGAPRPGSDAPRPGSDASRPGSDASRPGSDTGSSAGPVSPPDRSPAEAAVIDRMLSDMQIDDGGLRRVLIVGFSPALPSLLTELSRFVPHIELILALGTRGDETTSIGERLESLGLGLEKDDPLPGSAGRWIGLERGGHATVYTHEGSDLAGFAVRCLERSSAVDAAVFLAEPEAGDRDARTALRLLRFARALETGEAPRGTRLHLIAEFVSVARGERLRDHLNRHRCGFHSMSQLRLTLVSTEQIKNYFMVHSAFVPGVTALYDELLSNWGQEIVRLQLPGLRLEQPGREVPVRITLFDLIEASRSRGCIPIAVELIDGQVVLNPPRGASFPAAHIAGVYAIADVARLSGALSEAPAGASM